MEIMWLCHCCPFRRLFQWFDHDYSVFVNTTCYILLLLYYYIDKSTALIGRITHLFYLISCKKVYIYIFEKHESISSSLVERFVPLTVRNAFTDPTKAKSWRVFRFFSYSLISSFYNLERLILIQDYYGNSDNRVLP